MCKSWLKSRRVNKDSPEQECEASWTKIEEEGFEQDDWAEQFEGEYVDSRTGEVLDASKAWTSAG